VNGTGTGTCGYGYGYGYIIKYSGTRQVPVALKLMLLFGIVMPGKEVGRSEANGMGSLNSCDSTYLSEGSMLCNPVWISVP
jgi:hypothetical protein